MELAHARILIKANAAEGGPAWPDRRIAEDLEVSTPTAERVRQWFVDQGLEAALARRSHERPSRQRTLEGRAEARHIALACTAPLGGKAMWTMQMLTDKLVELEIDPAVCDETVRRSQKNELKPHLRQQWCIPPEASTDCVCYMEDVLDGYHRP